MTDWIEELRHALATQRRCVLVTMARVKGSTPREPGSKMVVWADGFAGSVGGGALEFEAQAKARARLADRAAVSPAIETFALGPTLGQCCGGSASLLYEAIDGGAADWLEALAEAAAADGRALLVSALDGPAIAKTAVTPAGTRGAPLPAEVAATAQTLLAEDERRCRIVGDAKRGSFLLEPLPEPPPTLALFGAGHVGQALVRVTAGLAFRTLWIDERAGLFPDSLPPGVTAVPAQQPALVADRLPPGSYVLVMTHSHDRDFELCERLLRRGDFAYLGLIGSDTKRARFLKRLRELGLPEARIARLTSPIGIPGISGKLPAEIAVAVAAQLLQVRDSQPASAETPLAAAEG